MSQQLDALRYDDNAPHQHRIQTTIASLESNATMFAPIFDVLQSDFMRLASSDMAMLSGLSGSADAASYDPLKEPQRTTWLMVDDTGFCETAPWVSDSLH
jgi:hypothetical protein